MERNLVARLFPRELIAASVVLLFVVDKGQFQLFVKQMNSFELDLHRTFFM